MSNNSKVLLSTTLIKLQIHDASEQITSANATTSQSSEFGFPSGTVQENEKLAQNIVLSEGMVPNIR